MYNKLKTKLNKLIPHNPKTSKDEEILMNFNIRLKNLKTKEDNDSKEEAQIVKKLIQRIENKMKKKEDKHIYI
jgi:hypothetical protein